MRLIDADELVEKMKHRKEYVGRPSDPVFLVEDAPTVPFWISVEERLPDDKEVFVLLKIKDVLVPDMGALINGNWWSTMSYNMMVGDPLFWAEIPHGPDGYKWYTDVEVNVEVNGDEHMDTSSSRCQN